MSEKNSNLVLPKIQPPNSLFSEQSTNLMNPKIDNLNSSLHPKKAFLSKMRTHEPLLFNRPEDIESILAGTSKFFSVKKKVSERQRFIFLRNKTKIQKPLATQQDAPSRASHLSRHRDSNLQTEHDSESRRQSGLTVWTGNATSLGLGRADSKHYQNRASGQVDPGHSNFEIRFSDFACLRKSKMQNRRNRNRRTGKGLAESPDCKLKWQRQARQRQKAKKEAHAMSLKVFKRKFRELHSIEEKFEILKEIGRGSYAVALLAIEARSQKKLVLKSFPLESFSKQNYLNRFMVGFKPFSNAQKIYYKFYRNNPKI